jgi:hypothetical protein
VRNRNKGGREGGREGRRKNYLLHPLRLPDPDFFVEKETFGEKGVFESPARLFDDLRRKSEKEGRGEVREGPCGKEGIDVGVVRGREA